MKPDPAKPVIAPLAAAREPVPANPVTSRRDDRFCEELSRVNNELANFQRELARTNAEMTAAQNKLAISEQRYRSLSESSPTGLFELDASGRCIYTNSHWHAISGLTAEESLGDGWQRVLDPRDAAAFLEARDLARQTGREFSREVRFVNARGDQRWAQVRSRVIPAEVGKATGRVSTVEDITEHKLAESKLRKLSRAVEQSPVSIVITNLLGEIEYVNPRFCTVTGYSFDEVRGKNPRVLKSGEMPLEFYRQMWAKITAGQEWRGEFHNRKKSGELYWESASISPISDDQGKVTHFVAVKEDITERKQASALLLESQQRLELATRSAQIGIWDWDLVANHKVWDAQMHVLYGIREQDYDESFAAWQKRLHPEDRDRVVADMQNAQAGIKDYNTEFRVVWPSGEVRHLEGHAIVQRAKNGSPARMIGMNRDITGRKHAEEALKEQLSLRERLAKIAANAPGIIYSFRLRPDGTVSLPYASPTIEEFCGVRAEDLADNASPFIELIQAGDRARIQESIADSARTMSPWRAEFRMQHPKKGLIWVEAQSTPERAADGSTLWQGFMSDVTERKRTEELLSRSEEKFRCLVESLRDAVMTMDPATQKFTSANSAAVKMFGAKNEAALISFSPEGLSPERQADGSFSGETARKRWEALVEGPQRFEWIHRRISGGEFFAEVILTRMENGGKPVFVGTIRDITERKQAEEILREKEQLLSESQRLGHVGSWLGDVAGPISWSNETYRIYGVSPDTFIPTMDSLLGLIHPDDRPAVLDWQTRCATGEKPGEMEFRVTRPDGSIRFLKRNGEAVYDANNRFIHMAGTVWDITEHKLAQAERANLERQVAEHKANEESARLAFEHEQKASQLKDRFVSLVSHEFRTPLSIINMAAELLDGYLDKLTEEERTEHLNEIKNSVGRMTQMMNDFLIQSNCASGKMKCQPARVKVEALCRRLIAEVPDYSGSPRAIECIVDPAVGEAWLDEKILRHIVGNLLSNAVKYSSAGQPVKLEVKRIAGGPQPSSGLDRPAETQLEFKVTDSGIGIPAAELARLFQTFHRAANVGNRPGTGMGLPIAKQFVDLLGGRIRIESTEGQGTTVWVELPAAAPARQ
jgi:PAS domain S-box-containing protein